MRFSFITLLIFAILLRIILFFLPAFQIDMNDWKSWANILSQNGIQNFYSSTFFSDYFPGYLYILWISGLLFKYLLIPINSLPFEIFLKTITSLFDIGTAFYVYKIVASHNKDWKFLAPILYLLTPPVLFDTSVWGQADGVFTFFLVMSAFFFIERKRIFKSSLIFALGVLVKPYSLALAPVLFLDLLKNYKKKIISVLLLGIFALIILSFPFFPKNPILGLLELANKSQNVYQYTSLYAFNFWGIVGNWQPDVQSYLLSFKTWGIILYLLSLVLIFLPLIKNGKKKISQKHLYFALALSLFSFFLFPTRIHERYLFPFFAFFLIAAIVKKSKLILGFYFLISILHLLNLWFVYYYYNYVYGISSSAIVHQNASSAYNFFYLLINNNFKFFSALMVIVFGILLVLYYKTYAKKD